MLGPVTALANVVSGRISVWFRNEEMHYNKHFACHTDPDRAERVARSCWAGSGAKPRRTWPDR
jgi:hypothetical protein